MDLGLQGRAEIETANVFFSSRGHTSSFRALLPKRPAARISALRFRSFNIISFNNTSESEYFADYGDRATDIRTVTGTYRTQLITVDHDGWVMFHRHGRHRNRPRGMP